MRNGLPSRSHRSNNHESTILLALWCLLGTAVGESAVGAQHKSNSSIPATSSAAIVLVATQPSTSIQTQTSNVTISVSEAATASTKSTKITPSTTNIGVAGVVVSSPRSTCLSRTVNYITHTLPQQCLKANYTTATRSDGSIASAQGSTSLLKNQGTDSITASQSEGDVSDRIGDEATLVDSTASASPSSSVGSGLGANSPDADADSPLDNVNFLSFEEWKKQNMARLDKAKEDQAREGGAGAERQGEINNVLASMSDGEDFDLSLGFGGTGSNTATAKSGSPQAKKSTNQGDKASPSERPRKKDAGTTCKERFNYASTDCAATILKTNPKCKSAASVLKENKDSYMLNECSINNKFLIVELCDDILVDTVVLANFEFFSSMFRTFRISVSDRYPVELDRWRDLGTFEARNAREIQPFAIHNPLIWARYLRVEFLNHYGAEYYCPVSLLRIHGTTMLDELRNPEEPTKADEESEALPISSASPVVVADSPLAKIEPEKSSSINTGQSAASASQTIAASNSSLTKSSFAPPTAANDETGSSVSSGSHAVAAEHSTVPIVGPLLPSSLSEQVQKEKSQQAGSTAKSVKSDPASSLHTLQTSSISTRTADRSASQAPRSSTGVQVSVSSLSDSTSSSSNSPIVRSHSDAASGSPQIAKTRIPAQEPSKSASTVVQPPAPSPTTQESFFKTFHKRLQVLESNATLSLQYIEEQSRILRDAFNKVEKRQKTKVDDFVLHLNTTVMAELRNFRQQYDQIWQSTILELESHRDDYQREILAVSTRLSMLAEELVWQKRMALFQTSLLVICLTLFIFGRSSSATGGHLELPIMQQWLNKSQSMLGIPFDSPVTHANRNGRRLMRVRSVDDLDEDSDEQNLLSSPSPAASASGKVPGAADDESDYCATPTKSSEAEYAESVEGTPTTLPTVTPRFKALIGQSRSGPTTPRGTRDPKEPAGFPWASERALESSPLAQSLAATVEDEDEDQYENASDHEDRETSPFARQTRDSTVDTELTLVNGESHGDTAADMQPDETDELHAGRSQSLSSDSPG